MISLLIKKATRTALPVRNRRAKDVGQDMMDMILGRSFPRDPFIPHCPFLSLTLSELGEPFLVYFQVEWLERTMALTLDKIGTHSEERRAQQKSSASTPSPQGSCWSCYTACVLPVLVQSYIWQITLCLVTLSNAECSESILCFQRWKPSLQHFPLLFPPPSNSSCMLLALFQTHDLFLKVVMYVDSFMNMYIHIFISTRCSACIMLFPCMFSGHIWHWMCSALRKTDFSHCQNSLLSWSSLCGVEALWACPRFQSLLFICSLGLWDVFVSLWDNFEILQRRLFSPQLIRFISLIWVLVEGKL